MRLDRVQSVCIGVLIGIGASYLLVCLDHIFAQTEPPAIWQPADTDSYTVLRSQSLFNAEQETVTGEYWAFDTDAHSGAKAAKGAANQWVQPQVRFQRTDVTWADELWVWCKPATEQPCSFQFASWKGRTSGYTQIVLPEWTLVRIPLFGIDAGNGVFDSIEDMYFSGELNQSLLVDDVWAVKLGPPPTVEPPPVDPPVDPAPVTYSKWSIQSIAATVTWSRVGSDGVVETQVIPVTLSIGAPQVTP